MMPHREPRQAKITVRGIELSYFEWGPDDAQPVLMVHATGFHARCWDETVRELGDGYRVVAIDMRGHGRSAKVAPYDWLQYGEDLAAFVEALDLREIIGVGHSMGGHAVTQAAGRTQDRFQRLLLVDPTIMAAQAYETWETSRTFSEPSEHPTARRKNDWVSWEEMYERFKNRDPFRLWRDQVLRDYSRYGVTENPDGSGYVLCCPPIVEASIYMGSGDSDIFDLIEKLVIPVLVMRAHKPETATGEMDFAASPTWEGLAGAFPNGRDMHLPELTHFIPMQRPDLVAEQIRTG
jgi:pimeloyl-ACP methyl ester carboxylesterase